MNIKRAIAPCAVLAALLAAPALTAAAGQEVGKVVALRGTATIERGAAKVDARVKTGILADDSIKTAAASRAKLLFIDDSVLTLGENSKLVVKEFIYAKGGQGKSIFNLLDGKMRSVVGKTKFEVQTPTAVAAARGTVIYFDVGRFNNQAYSRIICLEGNVEVRNVVSTVTGTVTLTPGTMVIVRQGETPPPPASVPPAELNRIREGGTGQNPTDPVSTDPALTDPVITDPIITEPVIPPPPPPPPPPSVQPPQPVQPTRVDINISIPAPTATSGQ